MGDASRLTSDPHDRTLYLDCQFGVAGDMLVAALLDLGGKAAEGLLESVLGALQVEGFSFEVSRVAKAGVDCCDFNVRLDAAHEGHDHDVAYLHGGESEQRHHHGEHAHHAQRGLAEIKEIICGAGLTPRARNLAVRAFTILANAESRAHAVPVEQVHFHEVGAVDSIVDIIAAAVLIDHLGVGRVIVPRLVDGCGSIRCQHGVIPVPVPATLNICMEHGLPLGSSGVEGELVTPTGAALVAALDPVFELPARYTVSAVGVGAGKRSYAVPSMLRAMLIEGDCVADTGGQHDRVIKLECDIDDSTPEQLAYAADILRERGALEVHWVPMYTKKGRPAYQLQVICRPGDLPALERAALCETTTIGVRRIEMQRSVLPREETRVQTAWGPVRAKRVELPDGGTRVMPEFDDVSAIARREGVRYDEVYRSAL